MLPKAIVLGLAASCGLVAQTVPGEDWERVSKAEAVGYSTAKLEALRVWLKAGNTTSMMISVGGKSLFEYGDVKLVSKIASVRKSILAMLFAKYFETGKINPDQTVKDLGLDDEEPFLPIKERATLIDLVTARSGIYLRSHREEDPGDKLRPKRVALAPGMSFYDHNWDFNAAGTAFEKLTGRNIYDAVGATRRGPSVCRISSVSGKRNYRKCPCPGILNTPCIFLFATWRESGC